MPFKSLEEKSNLENSSSTKQDNIQCEDKDGLGQERRIVYWITYNESTINKNVLLSFAKNDILTRKIKPHDCKKLIINGYGPRSSKLKQLDCYDIITKRHDIIRQRFKIDFKSSLEDIWVRIAVTIGMRDGRSQYHFNDIVKHVTDNPTFSTICRLPYLIRGIFDNHELWKQKMERKLMKKYNYIYNDSFKSDASMNGCFASIISDVYVQKNRDINRRLLNKHDFILVQRSSDHRELKKSRMSADNQSYFGLIKNVEYKNSDNDKKIYS